MPYLLLVIFSLSINSFAAESKVSNSGSTQANPSGSQKRKITLRTDTRFYKNLVKFSCGAEPTEAEIQALVAEMPVDDESIVITEKPKEKNKGRTPEQEINLAVSGLVPTNGSANLEDIIANLKLILTSYGHKVEQVTNEDLIKALLTLLKTKGQSSYIYEQIFICLEHFCSLSERAQGIITNNNGLELCLSYLKMQAPLKVKEAALLALSSIMRSNPKAEEKFLKSGSLSVLLTTLNDPCPEDVRTLESYLPELQSNREDIMLTNGFWTLIPQEISGLAIREGRRRPEIQIRLITATLIKKIIDRQSSSHKSVPINQLLPQLIVCLNLWGEHIQPYLDLIDFCMRQSNVNKNKFLKYFGVRSLWGQIFYNPHGVEIENSVLSILWKLYSDSSKSTIIQLRILSCIFEWSSHFSKKEEMIKTLDEIKTFIKISEGHKKLINSTDLIKRLESLVVGLEAGGQSKSFFRVGDGLGRYSRKAKRKALKIIQRVKQVAPKEEKSKNKTKVMKIPDEK